MIEKMIAFVNISRSDKKASAKTALMRMSKESLVELILELESKLDLLIE